MGGCSPKHPQALAAKVVMQRPVLAWNLPLKGLHKPLKPTGCLLKPRSRRRDRRLQISSQIGKVLQSRMSEPAPFRSAAGQVSCQLNASLALVG